MLNLLQLLKWTKLNNSHQFSPHFIISLLFNLSSSSSSSLIIACASSIHIFQPPVDHRLSPHFSSISLSPCHVHNSPLFLLFCLYSLLALLGKTAWELRFLYSLLRRVQCQIIISHYSRPHFCLHLIFHLLTFDNYVSFLCSFFLSPFSSCHRHHHCRTFYSDH